MPPAHTTIRLQQLNTAWCIASVGMAWTNALVQAVFARAKRDATGYLSSSRRDLMPCYTSLQPRLLLAACTQTLVGTRQLPSQCHRGASSRVASLVDPT